MIPLLIADYNHHAAVVENPPNPAAEGLARFWAVLRFREISALSASVTPCPPHDWIKQPDGSEVCWKCGAETLPKPNKK